VDKTAVEVIGRAVNFNTLLLHQTNKLLEDVSRQLHARRSKIELNLLFVVVGQGGILLQREILEVSAGDVCYV
jgi:hypothetical protein